MALYFQWFFLSHKSHPFTSLGKMLFPIFISLLIKAIKAEQVKINVGFNYPPVTTELIVIQNDEEVVRFECPTGMQLIRGVTIETTSDVKVQLKNSYCTEEYVYSDFSSAESRTIIFTSSDLPDTCRPHSIVVNFVGIPSVFKFGYKYYDDEIFTMYPVENGIISKINTLRSGDHIYVYLIDSPNCKQNILLETYEAKLSSYTNYIYLTDIPDDCYTYEVRVSFDSIPNDYTLGYKKIGDAEIQEITGDNLYLPNLDKGTQVEIYVKSSTCTEFHLVKTITAEIVSTNKITKDDLLECAPIYYLKFDLSDLVDVVGSYELYYYSETGNKITITDGESIEKISPFSISLKFSNSQITDCSEKDLDTFNGEKENQENIITITKEMLIKYKVPNSCIYPKRYLKISENFQNEYMGICWKVEDSIYGDSYYCKDSGEERYYEYYGPQETYKIYYLSAYCASNSYHDNFRFIAEVTSDKDISKGTYKYGMDIIADECKTNYKILVDMRSEKDAKYTLPDGVIETKQSDGYILFTGKTNFSITFTQERSECTNTLERTLYYKPPGRSYNSLTYDYPYKQDLSFYDCIYPEPEDEIIVGAVVGVVIAIVAVVAIIVIIIVVVIRKRRQKANQANSSENQDINADEV